MVSLFYTEASSWSSNYHCLFQPEIWQDDSDKLFVEFISLNGLAVAAWVGITYILKLID